LKDGDADKRMEPRGGVHFIVRMPGGVFHAAAGAAVTPLRFYV